MSTNTKLIISRERLKQIIKEELEKLNDETSLEEDYPESFQMDKFKALTSFRQRIDYCEEHLTRIAAGSARIAYIVDNEKVLKLAKNKKGIAQNEAEADFFYTGTP